MLAWIPFLEPANGLQTWWYLLLIPLAFGLAVIYKAIREPSMSRYWRSVWIMTTQIVFVIAAIAVALGVFVQVVIPVV